MQCMFDTIEMYCFFLDGWSTVGSLQFNGNSIRESHRDLGFELLHMNKKSVFEEVHCSWIWRKYHPYEEVVTR